MEEIITPRDVKTSRARVWQEEWYPMPWDYSRRTACTETMHWVEPRETYVTTYVDRFGARERREGKKHNERVRRYKQYQVHFYGDPKEKEMRNSDLRHSLKKQIESLELPQIQFVKRVNESQEIARLTREQEVKAREKERQHRKLLAGYKEENKMMIECHSKGRKKQRLLDLEDDQKKLSLNPINWTHSLW